MSIESQGKLGKSQGKVREKSGNSVSKIWQTPCCPKSAGLRILVTNVGRKTYLYNDQIESFPGENNLRQLIIGAVLGLNDI